MESNLVAEFVSETGASLEEAYNFLQAKGWDLKFAIHDYILSKDDFKSSVRPLLIECDSTDASNSVYKKLSRGISRAIDNVNLVNKARTELGLGFPENGVCNVNQYFIETPVFTFTLPDLSIFPDDFREFLEKDLIEISSLLSLEQAGRLNWWTNNGVCQRLWPLATTGDGNCLLHAASLGMWGFHDRLLTLRRALHDFLSCSTYKEALWRRWRWQLTRLNAEAGLIYTEEEWRKEWDSIVNMASSTPRNSARRRSTAIEKPTNKEMSENATYESLEEIHVLALSHVLKRPIIVIADTVLKDVHGEALAPILFGGIYLPFEISPVECHKSPLVLTFDAAHFSALVVMEKETFADKSPHPPAVIPLTDNHHKLLPLQFSVDPGENFVWGRDENSPQIIEKLSLGSKEIQFLLKEYLDVVYVPLSSSPLSDDTEFELELETPCDEEEIEKRFIEANGFDLEDNIPEISESSLFVTNKSKAAKQMKSVARQFGSIGKSMSKKLKKNLGTITKITRSNSQKKNIDLQSRIPNEDLTKTQDYILGARLHTEARHEYQEEMIKNYLTSARDRFERERCFKQKFINEDSNFDDEKLQEQAKLEGPKNCITQGCNMYGTVLTSYLCSNCYNKQRQEELSSSINSPSLARAITIPKKAISYNQTSSKADAPKYGTGRSTFYFEASPKSYESAKNFGMTSGKSLKPPDETIYLSNSTFYNDKPLQGGYNSKDWRDSNESSKKNALELISPNECQEHSKSWQRGNITKSDLETMFLGGDIKQINGLDLLTLSTDLSSTSNRYRMKTNQFKIPSETHKIPHDLLKGRTGTENVTYLEFHNQQDTTFQDEKIVCNSMPFENKPQIQTVTDLQSMEQLNGSCFESYLTKTKNLDHSVKLVDEQYSKTNVAQLMIEKIEYCDENNEKSINCGGEFGDNDAEYSDVKEKRSNIVEKNCNIGHIYLAHQSLNNKNINAKLCFNVTCKFFGSPELENYCSLCYRGRYEGLQLNSNSK